MIRRPGHERPDWQGRLASIGLDYHSGGREPVPGGEGGLWWHEADHYELTGAEVDLLDDATTALHGLCLTAVDHLVRSEPHRLESEFGMAPWAAEYAARSWLRGDPALMGRMDLAWNPAAGPPKMLEYNADTPTLAIETALAQWFWLEETQPGADQFNSLHEALLDGFRALVPRMSGRGMHFAAFPDAPEEWAHSTYFRDVAEQAGIATRPIPIPEIRWNDAAGEFRDEEENRILFLHKLYPWEWAATDEFGPFFARDTAGVIEPPWKAILSHKAILPLLWELNPGHPNLLEAHHGPAPATGEWVEKPALGREGANIRIKRDGTVTSMTGGTYGDGPVISQRRAPLYAQEGWNAIIGSWIAADRACGVIFREARGAVVRENSRVLPHLFR
ncbi:glutathionylspermidine synthase family protein [Roseomonas populi]|uniref:Glutathionylspermidine synthase family protein n=1 Tax=Roseomonas populi TaxID=3121582 RepID=A0ABT1X9G4_9PROT|nr:glutathionylspermidine synthase family protein [Roseomonas pecuniae]MCR0984406.1 glutathionylspermidine synthase family protein [Roseomonas pecuniae]